MKKRITAILICMTMMLAACGSESSSAASSGNSSSASSGSSEPAGTVVQGQTSDNADEAPAVNDTENPYEPEIPETPVINTFAASVNQFNWNLFAEAAEYGGENLFYSPFSIDCALAMANTAANGDTRSAIESVLGISDFPQFCADLKAFMAAYSRPDDEEGLAKFLSANSLWIAEGLNLSTDYAEKVEKPLTDYFNAEIREADFMGNIDTVKRDIRTWVAEHTENMIPNYDSIADPDTVADFLNAVYFYGEWVVPFEAMATREGDFHGTNGTSTVPMMHASSIWLRYINTDSESAGLTGVALPYKGGAEMDIFLAPEGEDIVSIFNSTDKDRLFSGLSAADELNIRELQLPKFKMDLTFNGLSDMLQDMGLEICFTPEADFSSLSSGLLISEISHRAKIEVDEAGSRAAAVTEITMKETGMEQSSSIDFIVDRPFIYVIRDTESGAVLFTGLVNNL